jgi:hypothetical protein
MSPAKDHDTTGLSLPTNPLGAKTCGCDGEEGEVYALCCYETGDMSILKQIALWVKVNSKK